MTHHSMEPTRVEVVGTDMLFGKMVAFAFKWLFAFALAGLPFAVVAVIVVRLLT